MSGSVGLLEGAGALTAGLEDSSKCSDAVRRHLAEFDGHVILGARERRGRHLDPVRAAAHDPSAEMHHQTLQLEMDCDLLLLGLRGGEPHERAVLADVYEDAFTRPVEVNTKRHRPDTIGSATLSARIYGQGRIRSRHQSAAATIQGGFN